METIARCREIKNGTCILCKSSNHPMYQLHWFQSENFRGIQTFIVCEDCKIDITHLITTFNKQINYMINIEFDNQLNKLRIQKENKKHQLSFSGV